MNPQRRSGCQGTRVRASRVRRGSRKARGQALVEFALIFPVFLVLFFGVIDMGRYVYMRSVLSQAAREGARLAAVEASWIGASDPSCGAAGGPVCPAGVTGGSSLQAHATAAANRMVAPFASVNTLYLSCTSAGGAPTGEWTGVSCASRNPGDVVSVRVMLTFTPLTPIIGQMVGSVTTSGSATMVIN